MKKIFSAFLVFSLILASFSIIATADGPARYNYYSTCEATTDMAATFTDNSGGGWATGSQTIIASGGINDSKYIEYNFSTKTGGNVTSNGSYGIRFPIWTNSTTSTGSYAPDGVNNLGIQGLVDAISDGAAVSLWVKTTSLAGADRKVSFKFETKDSPTGGTTGTYTSSKITLPNNDNWNLISIPLSDFKRSGTAINTTDVLNAETNIPYKFQVLVNYTDFSNITTAPAVAGDVVAEKIAFDNIIIERKLDTRAQPISMINYNSLVASEAVLEGLSFADEEISVPQDPETPITINYPQGASLDYVKTNLSFTAQNGLTETNISEQIQFKNGAYAVFTPPEALPGAGTITVESIDTTVKNTYTLNFAATESDTIIVTKKYNYFTHCEETNDNINSMQSAGGGFSTAGGSTGKVTNGGIDGNCLRASFKPKPFTGEGVDANATLNASYGFEFMPEGTYTPEIGSPAVSTYDALLDTEAVSLWIKVPTAAFSRKIALRIECKPEAGANIMYETPIFELISDDAFHLYKFPLSSFKNSGVSFTDLDKAYYEETARPFKFAFVTNYVNFLNIETGPATQLECDALQTSIYYDDIIFERKVNLNETCPYPVVVPRAANAAYAADYTLNSLSIGGISTDVSGNSITLEYPEGLLPTQLKPSNIKAIFENPTVLTDVSAQVQYKNGGSIVGVTGNETNGYKLTVYSGDYNMFKEYPMILSNTATIVASPIILGYNVNSTNVTIDVLAKSALDVFDGYIAVYDKDGRLSDIKANSLTNITGGGSFNIDLADGSGKLMLWNDTLMPYINPINID